MTSVVVGTLPGMVDQLDPEPLYRQLANVLRQQIQSGVLAKGQPIPSESYLQQEHGVARGTVRAAIKLLADERLIVTIQGRGSYVL